MWKIYLILTIMAFNMFLFIYIYIFSLICSRCIYVCIYKRSGQLKFGNLFLHSYISDTLPIFLSYLVFVWLEGNGMHCYDNWLWFTTNMMFVHDFQSIEKIQEFIDREKEHKNFRLQNFWRIWNYAKVLVCELIINK